MANVVRLFALFLIVAGALGVAYGTGVLTDASRARDLLSDLRAVPALPLWFTLAYAAIAGAGVPPLVMSLAGGAVFGTAAGAAYSWMGGVLGAAAGYGLARQLGADAARALLGSHASLLDRALARADFLMLLRLRLIPVVPYGVINLGAGLSRAPFVSYLAASALGILPATVVYAWFADSLVEGTAGARQRAMWHALVAGLLIVVVSFAPVVVRRMRGAQRQKPYTP